MFCDGLPLGAFLRPPEGNYGPLNRPAEIALSERLRYNKCDRSGQYRKATLIEKYGADVSLPDLLHMIGAGCPKIDALAHNPCAAHYRDL